MNRLEIVNMVRDLTAYPGRGTTQTDRVVKLLNLSLRQLWADTPDALLREEWRFRLEPPISTSTIFVEPTDALVMTLTAFATTARQWPTDGTLRGRWLEVTKGSQKYYRRIRDVWVDGQAPNERLHLAMDFPWENASDTGLSYRIFTLDYPYPSDVQKILACYYKPEASGSRFTRSALKAELDRIRHLDGWLEAGTPEIYGRGDFYSIPSPHYTPVAAVFSEPQNPNKWGYDDAGVEQTAYGVAGTFSYRCIHVWGRRVPDNRTQEGVLEPWYASEPSGETGQVTTTWGGGKITVTSPDLDYVYGYGPNNTRLSYHHHGMEKWWFRARHASQATGAGNNAQHPFVENDGVYYLWKVTPGYQTSVDDKGDADPVDRRITLKDNHGHQSIRFDKLPSTADPVVAMLLRRPPVLQHDFDPLNINPECITALINLTCAYLVGRRDGEPDRESFYYATYLSELERLRELAAVPGHDKGPFGDGLGSRPGYGREGDVTWQP